MASSPDFLSAVALDWARTHLTRFGDSDLFPVPFEIRAINHYWNQLKPQLLQTDLGSYRARALRRFLVPKASAGFRVGTQLDPVDSLVFTALVYEAAANIEASRVTRAQRVACSYRVQLDPNGSFFSEDTGWRDFHTRSTELSDPTVFSYVVTADIADFYSHAGHHKIENALESAGIPSERASHIEELLMKFTAKQSRGLPVGPAASALLAEACMNDVDTWLMNRGVTHVRYVDDFRIFCRSESDAVRALHDLTDYLYTSHRLTLQSGKTKIRTTPVFILRELSDPREEEERGRLAKLSELTFQAFYTTGVEVDVGQLDPDDVKQAIRANLRELFDSALSQRPLHLGLIRYVLRRATGMRTAVLIDRVVDHLDVLTSVLREVALYLRSVKASVKPVRHGRKIVAVLRDSPRARLPYGRMLGLSIIEDNPALVSLATWRDLAMSSEPDLGIRPTAMWAAHHRQLDWIRARKETWANHGPWDRRAIIWSGAALPKDERRKWLELVAEESFDVLDQAVAHAARAKD